MATRVATSFKTALRARFQRWALHGRLQESFPIRLSQNRIYVLPTRRGLAFAGMLGLMLTGAMNYNLSLGYALVFLLTGIGTLTILHTFRNLAHLEILPGRCPPAFAGQQAHFGLILSNDRPSARPDLKLHLPECPTVLAHPGPVQRLEIQLQAPALQRGWQTMPRLTLETTYPLGLVRAWAYALPEIRCLIYPSPTPESASLPLPLSAGQNSGPQLKAEGLDDFAGLRRHQPADPLQHVAWKAAARLNDQALLTKQFSSTAARNLHFDWDSLPPDLGIEQRLSQLTRWLCDAQAARLSWSLRLPTHTLGPATGDAHFHACLKELALYGPPR